jgi:hypothetical protein
MLNPPPVRSGFYVGDRVSSIGNISSAFGIGRITEIDERNVATVVFGCGAIQSYNFAMLKKAVS